MNDTFDFIPSEFVPFRDKVEIERCRAIKREDIDKHSNPDFRIRVVKETEIPFMWITDVYSRIKMASEEGRRCVSDEH